MKLRILMLCALITLMTQVCSAQKKVIDAGGQVAFNIPKEIASLPITRWDWRVGDYNKLKKLDSSKTSATFLGVASTSSVVVTYYYWYKYSDNEKEQSASFAFTVTINKVYPTSINIDQETTVGWGQYVTLPINISPLYAETSIMYDSDNTDAITVDSSGHAYGKGLGEANIYIKTDNGLSTRTHMRCIVPELKKIRISGYDKKQKLYPGDELQLSYTVTPEHSQAKVTWSSSNEEIATVDANGHVKILSNGTVHIYCTNSNGKKDDVKLKPKKAEQKE